MSALLDWFDAHRRPLPWRDAPTPWRVWVSEVMLQQTRASSVAPYFERFVERFPTPAALAAAPEDELLALWAGLGYYARARHLQAAARRVVEEHGGRVPDDVDGFGALPGVGPYTRGAVLSIAFGRAEPVLDGNVERVLCRLDRVAGDPRQPTVRRALWARAGDLLDPARPGDHNQALMELGATVCTPRTPRCAGCPLQPDCLSAGTADAERLPNKPRRVRRPLVERVAGLVRDGAGVWLVRRPSEGMLGGLWELPAVEGTSAPDALGALGLRARGDGKVVRHLFTHREWRTSVYEADGAVPEGRPFPERELAGVALTGPSLKALLAWGLDLPRRRGAGAGWARPGSTSPP